MNWSYIVVNDEEQKADNESEEETTETAEEAVQEVIEDISEAVEDIAGAEITLEHLQEELAQAKDAALRAQAEAQNARRRSEQDVEKARKYALERFAGDLLPVVDNLQRAVETAIDSDAEGVNLTLKSLLDVLGKYNIESVDPTGEPFDPALHQAMTMVPNPDMEPNTVMEVMQRGYTLSGRLIRPAMVIVSKAPD